MSKQFFSSGSEFERTIGYSRAVRDGDFVFVSGTTGYNYTEMTISPDPATQAEQCMKNIAAVLAEAGSSMQDVVRVTYIFPDRDDFESCWPVFNRYFATNPPAATMLVAGLYEDDMKLEVQVTARVS